MATVKPIRTEANQDAVLARIDQFMGAAPGAAEAGELDLLPDLVEISEARSEPMGHRDPVAFPKKPRDSGTGDLFS